MKAQEKIQIISEISSSNLSDGLKLKLIREAAQEAAQAAQTDQAGKKPRKAAQPVKRDGRPTLTFISLENLQSCAGTTIAETVSDILHVYPEKTVKTVTDTTIRRFKGEMTLPENTEIVKEGQNEEGQDLYFLRQIEQTQNV